MSTVLADAALLRDRAVVLRRLAGQISSCDAVRLRLRAGDEVWTGPTAAACHDDLVQLGRRLVRAGDDLLERARRLERRAAELDTAS